MQMQNPNQLIINDKCLTWFHSHVDAIWVEMEHRIHQPPILKPNICIIKIKESQSLHSWLNFTKSYTSWIVLTKTAIFHNVISTQNPSTEPLSLKQSILGPSSWLFSTLYFYHNLQKCLCYAYGLWTTFYLYICKVLCCFLFLKVLPSQFYCLD